jgi:outer membrane protein assembly factor BamB
LTRRVLFSPRAFSGASPLEGDFTMRKRGSWCLFFTLAIAAGISAAERAASTRRSHDWPQWQGPQRNAISDETGLLSSWPPQGPRLIWNVSGLGGGYTTPSIAAGKIFGMGFRGEDEVVWALDETSGKEIWSTHIAQANRAIGYGDGSRSTPTVDGDKTYALGVSGDLVCLDTATGKELWHKNLVDDFGGQMMSGWGYSESPLVDGDRLICTPGGANATLVALDKATGAVNWKSMVPHGGGAGYASVVTAEAGGKRMYIQWLGSALVGVDAADGRFLWRYARVANHTANIPTPIVQGNLVFCSTGYKAGSALLRLVPSGDTVKAEEVYYLPGDVLQNHHGGLVLIGDYLYGGHGHNDGTPVCVEFKTGKIVWKKTTHAGKGSAAVLFADGEVYFRYQDGLMCLVDASPKAYHQTGQFRLPYNSHKPSWPHPVIANGRLYIRDQEHLLCFDVKKH